MAGFLIRQLESTSSYAADGLQTIWNFSFAGGYLDPSHVKAFSTTPAGVREDLAPILVGSAQVRIEPAVPLGHELTIYRDTPTDGPLVDFADLAAHTEASLDTANKQAIFAAAEAKDAVARMSGTSISLDLQAQVDLAQGYRDTAGDHAYTATNAASLAVTSKAQAAGSAAGAGTSAAASAASAAAAAASASAAASSAEEAAGAKDVLQTNLAGTSGAAMVGFSPQVAYPVDSVGAHLQAVITAPAMGAVGNGVTDETATFATIETRVRARAVDLLGRTYLVTTVPSGNDYYNGGFKVGSEVFWLNRNPREHPFANPTIQAKALMPTEGKYRGLTTACFQPPGTGNLVVVYREALGHGPENGRPVNCAISDDFGDRFGLSTSDGLPTRVIAQQANADIRNWASGTMGNGRLGILAARRDFVGGSYLDSLFLYSDDAGVTWNTVNVPITTASWDSHSRIYPYPASAGGHDTLGFIAYAYTTSHGICAMKTVNNGASWTEALTVVRRTAEDAASPAANLSEMSVARIGTQNKWVMAVRTNQEAAIATSTNMTTWTLPKLIPVSQQAKMLANPPELTYDDGKLWLWSFSRRGNKEIQAEYANALVVAEGDAEAVYASVGVSGWKPWRVVSSLPFWPSGYLNTFKVRNRNYALCTTGEDTAGSTGSRQCVMTLLGPDPTVTVAPHSLSRLVPKPNLYPGGDWRYFPLGDTHVSGAARVTFAPMASFARAGGVVGGTLTRLAGSDTEFKLRIRRDDGNADLANLNTIFVLPMEDCAQLRGRFITVAFDAIAASGFSSAAGFLTVRARSTTSTVGAVVTGTVGTFPTGDTTVQSSNSGVTLTDRWQSYEMVIGPFDADINQVLLQFQWTPVGTANNDFFELTKLRFCEGKVAGPHQATPLALVKSWADRYIRVFSMPTINGRSVRHMDPPMHRAPSWTISRGTGVGFMSDYISIDDTVNSLATVTLIAPM